MRRREVIAAAGIVAGWPLIVRAQGDRVRRVGVLLAAAENSPQQQARNVAFEQRMNELGWVKGQNLSLDYRWAAGDMALIDGHADSLVRASPDVILAVGSNAVRALLKRTRRIPIVFQIVPDPVGQEFVQSQARPGGNVTGFSTFDDRSMGGKWIETLKELAPGIRRVLFIRGPGVSGAWLPALEEAARILSLEFSVAAIRDLTELKTALADSAPATPTGAVLPPFPYAAANLQGFSDAFAAAGVPAIGSLAAYARAGGLATYGPDLVNLFRQGAGVIDRILRGADPAEIPVQNPIKFELVLNLRSARALGLTVPPTLLALADEVIE